jgi:hypothetical protein
MKHDHQNPFSVSDFPKHLSGFVGAFQAQPIPVESIFPRAAGFQCVKIPKSLWWAFFAKSGFQPEKIAFGTLTFL